MTLTCDATARPIGLVPVRDAVARLARAFNDGVAKTQALINDETRIFRTQCGIEIPYPLVVMTNSYVELAPREVRRVTSRVLFARDGYTCQYCGFQATPGRAHRELTVDHVKPQHLFDRREDAHTWDNVVAACARCNNLKGGKLPMEAHMMPATTPKEPHFVQVRFAGRLNDAQASYVRDYFNLHKGEIVL